MSFPRYPKYKDSGVEWLGEVPEGWAVLRLNQCASINDEDLPESTDAAFSMKYIDISSVDSAQGTYIYETMAFCNAPSRARRIVRKGDVIVSTVRTYLKAIASITHYEEGLIVSTGFAVVRPRTITSEDFARYALLATTFIEDVISRSTGVSYPAISAHDLGYVKLPMPSSMSEQQEIASFLDQETAKIDALIEEQQRLIGLLKEKCQAVISHAVTRGLNPSVVLERTGIEWAPEAPSHWTLFRIADVFRDSKEQGSDGLPILSVSIHHGVSDKELSDDDLERTVNRSEDVSKYKRVYRGDLTYNMMRAWQGAFGAVVVDGMVSPAYVVARPLISIHARFVERLLRTSNAISEMKRFSKGVTDFRLRLYWEEFKTIRLPLPPLEEQAAILTRVEEVEDRATRLTESAEHNIAFLRERRSALISAAVTGRIDVRQPIKKPVASVKPYNSGFAHQLLAATILGRCNDKHMGRVKLQKLIHVTEYHAQIEELKGQYTRQMAGPLDKKAMAGLERGLEKQHWYKTIREGQRYRYLPLEKKDQHQQYLEQWADKQDRIQEVMTLMGGMNMRQCEIVSTLYAAWNDLLIDGLPATEGSILAQAATAEGWHESKERTPKDKWVSALRWMRQHELIPTGFGSHTRKASPEGIHEPA